MAGTSRPAGRTRLAAQLLAGNPGASVAAVVDRLVALQAQEVRGFRLAIRARSRGTSAADVDAGLEDASLVVTWLHRGTLQLVAADDYWWLHPLTTPQLITGSRRRLRQEGVDDGVATRAVDLIADATAAAGPLTRAALRTVLDRARVPTGGQALPHLLRAANLAGAVVRGPMRDGQPAYVNVAEWLGPRPPGLEPDHALARLACRYLAGHGPAAPADLAKWAGIALGAARRAFAAAASETRVWADGLVVSRAVASRRAPAPARLLGPFDPLLLGWATRDEVVGPHRGIVTSNGVFRPVALVDGRAVATWGLAGGEIAINPLEPIARTALEVLEDDAADVLRFLGLPARPAVVAG